MRVLLTGCGGQLGTELLETIPLDWEVRALDCPPLDIADREAVLAEAKSFAPDLVVNAAAYTDVDGAETDRETAFAVNGSGTGHLAEAAHACGARMIHVSTDFVFDGAKGRPNAPGDEPHPTGVYGESKLEGERRVSSALGERGVILRTAWLYALQGRNFVHTMLRLLAERGSVDVVSDQVGTPTWARGLARAVWAAAERESVSGVHHWTDAGVASWYDFAVAIREEALAFGLLERAGTIRPVTSEAFPRPARRPSYSVLDKTATWEALGVEPVHWRAALREMLGEMRRA